MPASDDAAKTAARTMSLSCAVKLIVARTGQHPGQRARDQRPLLLYPQLVGGQSHGQGGAFDEDGNPDADDDRPAVSLRSRVWPAMATPIEAA